MRITYPKAGLSVAGVLVSVYRHRVPRYQSAVPRGVRSCDRRHSECHSLPLFPINGLVRARGFLRKVQLHTSITTSIDWGALQRQYTGASCAMSPSRRKSETLTVRVTPAFKTALRAAAEAERRSLANLLEVAVVEYCQTRGLNREGARTRNRSSR